MDMTSEDALVEVRTDGDYIAWILFTLSDHIQLMKCDGGSVFHVGQLTSVLENVASNCPWLITGWGPVALSLVND